MRIAIAFAFAVLTTGTALAAQDSFLVEYRSGVAEVRAKQKGMLVVTADTIFFRGNDAATGFAIPIRTIDSVFAVYGDERTTGATILSGLAGGIALGIGGAFGYGRRGRSQVEFLCVRVGAEQSPEGLSLDSTRIVLVKTKNRQAVEIGNAIWSRMNHPATSPRQPTDSSP